MRGSLNQSLPASLVGSVEVHSRPSRGRTASLGEEWDRNGSLHGNIHVLLSELLDQLNPYYMDAAHTSFSGQAG